MWEGTGKLYLDKAQLYSSLILAQQENCESYTTGKQKEYGLVVKV